MKKILIVDDDEFFPKTLASALPVGKYKIVMASDGAEGMEKLKTENPDLVILDLLMPKMDGTEFLRAVNADKDIKKIPILVSSNLTSMKKVGDCLSMGAAGYILKSDESLDTIVQDIERILG